MGRNSTKQISQNGAETKALFEDDENIDEALRINQKYANRFETRKDKEELQRLINNPSLKSKALKKSKDPLLEISSDDSDDEEEEDSDAEMVTKEVGAKVLETISRIKFGRKEIYDKEKRFFDDDDFEERKKNTEGKMLTFTKFMSSTLKKEGADAFVKEEFEKGNEKTAVKSNYEESQQALKIAFLEAANKIDNEDIDDLLQAKQKTEDEQREENFTFQEFLKKRALGKTKNERQLLERYFKRNEEFESSELFLRDYILHECWKGENKMPQGALNDGNDVIDEKEDEQILEDADQFEAAYNFRYEEDAGQIIEGHARQVLDSVRQKDDKRRRKRLEYQARKQAEKKEKRIQVERLKQLKQKEFIERLQIIQRISGTKSDLNASNIDFDKEFDEEEHEQQMKEILGQDFDEQDEMEDAEHLLSIPEGLEGDDDFEAPVKHLSSRQKKKLEKLAKKQAKFKSIEIDNGDAYPPVAPDKNDDMKVLSTSDNEYNSEDVFMNHSKNSYINENGKLLWFLCDGCQIGIPAGAKIYHCITCQDFTLCTKCFRSIRHPHQLIRKRVPHECKPPKEYLSGNTTMSSTCRELGLPMHELDESKMTEEQKAMINEMIDEYYALDFEDIIGDLPVRFKYAKVTPKDYGLTIDEILEKSDKELNQHISLKKLAPYRESDGWNSRRHKHYLHQQNKHKNKNHKIGKGFKGKIELSNNTNKRSIQKKTKLIVLKKSVPKGITEDRLAAYGLTSFPQKRQQYQIRQKNNKQKCKNHQEIAFKSSSLDSETKQ